MMHPKPSLAAHGNASSKTKDVGSGHVSSPGQMPSHSQIARPPASGTAGKTMPAANSRPSPQMTGNASRPSPLAQGTSFRPSSMDDDSDDDKPLLSRVNAARGTVPNLQAKDSSKNGFPPCGQNPGIVRTAFTNAHQRSSQQVSDDDSDDDKPLASRLPIQPSVKVSARDNHVGSDDSDDDKPLIMKRPSNGPLLTGHVKQASGAGSIAKKRPPDERGKGSDHHITKKLKPSIPQTNSVVKMDIDEDDIPLAQRIPVATSIKKSIVVMKKPATSLRTTLAAKKVVEARKTMLKHKKIIKTDRDAKGDKNEPGAGGGQKWTTLEHSGVIFPPPYTPHGVKMLYDKKPVNLTPEQEEVATMFAVMRDTEYVTKPKFLTNFWNDWKKKLGPNHVIQKLELCDFTPIYEWSVAEKEKKKQLSSEEKKRLKEEKLKQEEKYMWALVDGVKEKVGNFRVEPPGLFRGRGEHPKMGKLKRRIFPEDIVINIGADAPVPECPMPGRRWKEIRHDNTVTWLAYWNDPINVKEFKYVFLAASSSLKGQSDKEKYEKARTLKDYIEDIRITYTKNFTSPDPTTRQIAVATYLIDRLALRAGNEKDDDEADTVGCCSLKVEHVTLVPPKSLQFDFLGKDSIRYFNTVVVVEPVYKAIGDFKKGKQAGRDLFDKLDTTKLNAHLKNIMPHLTAKVFRTYNASITLDNLLVDTDGDLILEKIASYQRANKEVAILCNHQRSVSKSHEAQMGKLEGKMAELEDLLNELQTDLDRARKGKPPLKDADGKPKRNQSPEALGKKIEQTRQKIEKMKLDMRIKDDLKTVALGTSKINYMDPRITVAWCKRHEVPIEKVFNKSLLAKFAWAMDVDMNYRF